MFDLEQYLQDLESVVNIDSNSYDPEGLNRCVDRFEAIARRMGLYVKRHTVSPLTGDFLEISNRPDAERYDVIMMGHIDTVQPTGTAAKRPFRNDGTCVYGPGACDMKPGTLAMLYIAKELSQEANDKLALGILMNCDEEISSRYTRQLTRQIAAKAGYGFVLESHNKIGFHTTSRKGSGTYRIKFHGKAGHSGFIFEKETANAVVEMARWATELHNFNDRKANLSVNIASASGGKAANVVPDYAELLVNIRVVNRDQYDLFEEKLRQLAATPVIPGVTVEIEIDAKRPPMVPVPEMEDYLVRVRKVFESIGQPFELYPTRGGCSDGCEMADVGLRCIDSLGPYGDGGHTNNELIYISDIEPCIQRLTALIEEIASQRL